ncbi:MAG: hypothetical protein M0C28_42340 [Candidatus Moduliflexus flocculans]|nr:hypothetical protein [Candidatus Moduliflexus flocculans]
MAIRIGINGFGRIGGNMLRAVLERPGHRVRGRQRHHRRQDPGPPAQVRLGPGHLQGRRSRRPKTPSSSTAGRSRVLAVKEIGDLPWKDLGVAVVIESTGKFTKRPDVIQHIEKGGALEGHRLRPGHRSRRHPRPGRQREDLRPGQAPHHLQRLLHDQLPGPGRQGPPRELRRRARAS